MASRQPQMIHEVDIKRVTEFRLAGLLAVDAVEIGLHVKPGSVIEIAFPTGEYIASRENRIRVHDGKIRRREIGDAGALSHEAIIDIALECHSVLAIDIPVRQKASLRPAPIVEIPPVRMKFRAARSAFPVN